MKDPDLRFEISHKIGIHVDLHRKRAVISCVLKDGKSLHLETSYEVIDHIHQEIQKQLDRI
jgi:hypothetical protein